MADNQRLVNENNGRQQQGVRERITWEVDVSEWGDDPTDPAVLVTLNGEDVTADVVDGVAAVSGNIWSVTVNKNVLQAGKLYTLYAQFAIDGNELEAMFEIRAS